MLIPVCRSRKYFFAIHISTWNNHFATSKNSRHSFAKLNENEGKISAMKEYYSRLQCSVKRGNFLRNLDLLFLSCSYNAVCTYNSTIGRTFDKKQPFIVNSTINRFQITSLSHQEKKYLQKHYALSRNISLRSAPKII